MDKIIGYWKYLLAFAIVAVTAMLLYPWIKTRVLELFHAAAPSSENLNSPEQKKAASVAMAICKILGTSRSAPWYDISSMFESNQQVVDLLNENLSIIPIIETEYKACAAVGHELWADINVVLSTNELAQIKYLNG